MKNRKREETTKKTKRQTSEAKKSESEKGSSGSRGETKRKRSRNGGDEKAKRSGRSEPGGFREEVQREGMERRFRSEIRRGGVDVRFEGQGMQKGEAEGRQRGEEPGGASPCAARSPPAATLRTTETHSSGNRARAHSRYEPPRPARSCP